MEDQDIPGDHTSPVLIGIGESYTGLIDGGADADAVGIDLVGGQSYRITLDPADATTAANKDPLIADILNSAGASLGFSNDDSGSGAASVLIFTPSVSGTYFVVVSSQGPNDPGGSWTVEVNNFTAPADDFGNDLDASDPISLGETQDAIIGAPGDTDTIALFLEAGVAVDITVYGNDGGFYGELADSKIVSFVNANGVAINPVNYETAAAVGKFTSGVNLDAHQITFTPPTTGNYFITVGSGDNGIGDYSVSISEKDRGVTSIRENEAFQATGNPEIDAFFLGAQDTNVDHIYTDRDGDGVTTLTYSLPPASPGFSPAVHNVVASEWTVGFAPATGAVLDTFIFVLDAVSTVASVEFVEVPDTGVEAGTFRIGTTEMRLGSPTSLVTGWSGFPEWMMAGETWINLSLASENLQIFHDFGVEDAELGNFLTNRTLHEFTHNLGLNHADRSTLAGGIDPLLLGQDYSVMSRTSTGLFPDALLGDLFPQTLMWLDIQAIQAAYGVNTVATAGADIYAIDTDARNFRTIWDYSGVDSIVLSGGADAVIDLKPGTWQNVGSVVNYYGPSGTVVGVRTDTIFIAPDTMIENAQGAAGDDQISGNASANTLSGGGGDDLLIGRAANDVLSGGAGDDVLRGGAGADALNGGAGVDAATYSDSFRGVSVDLRVAGQQPTGLGLDSLVNIEGLIGSAFDDALIGDGGPNALSGLAGDDNLSGLGGNDTLGGGPGDDMLDGGGGINDEAGYVDTPSRVVVDLRISAPQDTQGAGTDTIANVEGLIGSAFNDVLTGDSGNNRLTGGDGDDALDGRFGRDVMSGGAGNDTMTGGNGNDVMSGGSGNDVMIAGAGVNDVADYSGAPNAVAVDLRILTAQDTGWGVDTLSGMERIIGSAFSDTLIADAGNNKLLGGVGADILRGQFGRDILDGGLGPDVLQGGAGPDEFIFNFMGDISPLGDEIVDLGADDLIDLSRIEANQGLDLDFIGLAAFTGTPGEVRYGKSGGVTQLKIDGDGDGAPERFITITNGVFDLVETSANSLVLQISGGAAAAVMASEIPHEAVQAERAAFDDPSLDWLL